ncbi:MAG TPA: aldehyde dehydrogenase EutE [Phycisphaerae bacterium]|nr:aldehyde dehydrogenase EutE [Phycisphaerae bacterium]HOJ72863.1 aldehyde dehydrogenase EutE [Phycisphaerae bacterium]HOM51710.1 aldehyde dehydrogenase EutE [Phycisphaerae bacterium]HON66895.1 aldehyde dehydrogenase EutE [Phycisphaerae bacterium]HOQ87993.1 aldehyde dehydrogenase EutE [Phycisphaerae bacterium]
MSAINEALIRDVVNEVLNRLQGNGNGASARIARPAPAGVDGVFPTVDDAVAAAKLAFQQLSQAKIETRAKAIDCIREICIQQAEELGRFELEETKIGRLDHKIAKLVGVGKSIRGIETLKTDAYSGDYGITLVEYAPYGVLGVITPVTHSIPTLACNAIMMIAAGNTMVVNAHPSGNRSAILATQRFNRLIKERTGLENLICIIEKPTLETANEIFKHPDIKLLCVTGGPGLVKAAMASPKKAIVAGPGNPPVVVDETADIEKAAAGIIYGCAFDNNVLCIAEKEVFVVASVADQLLDAFGRHGGYRLNTQQIDALAKVAIHKDEKTGHWVANKEFVGKDPQVLAAAIGLTIPAGTQILYGEVDVNSPWLPCEQMMPFLPVMRCRCVNEAIDMAVKFEHGFGHTAMIWSKNVENMTRMGKAVNTTIFVKNGHCMTGLGSGGEGYGSYSIASPTGEGITSTLTYTRQRRCVMVENLRIV